MVVAIVSAVRTGWKDQGNIKDEWYFWRNAHSNIWYSSEITGTIIVQCIPVLRPLLRDFRTSMTSRRLASAHGETGRRSKYPTTIGTHGQHRAHIYSDAQGTYVDGPSELKDSWDGQGIYQKKDFELTTMEVKSEKDTMLARSERDTMEARSEKDTMYARSEKDPISLV
jgi:hypothetical protein